MLKKRIQTAIGAMIAVADDTELHLLEFTDRKNFDRQFAKLPTSPQEGENAILKQIGSEITAYFNAGLTNFKTPYKLSGTPFQISVWQALAKIPHAQTPSYSDIARAIHKEKAVRGAASAIGANQLAIIIPCHRVIGANGALTGYAGGLERKKWLLDHERSASY